MWSQLGLWSVFLLKLLPLYSSQNGLFMYTKTSRFLHGPAWIANYSINGGLSFLWHFSYNLCKRGHCHWPLVQCTCAHSLFSVTDKLASVRTEVRILIITIQMCFDWYHKLCLMDEWIRTWVGAGHGVNDCSCMQTHCPLTDCVCRSVLDIIKCTIIFFTDIIVRLAICLLSECVPGGL